MNTQESLEDFFKKATNACSSKIPKFEPLDGHIEYDATIEPSKRRINELGGYVDIPVHARITYRHPINASADCIVHVWDTGNVSIDGGYHEIPYGGERDLSFMLPNEKPILDSMVNLVNCSCDVMNEVRKKYYK